ncbi:MAG: hypothetical protein K8I30_04070 [Anaerolineae bacterium]|nr:hypothetical protein [Anaerolineae bacterium]
MALNIHVTRIEAIPISGELPSKAGQHDRTSQNISYWTSSNRAQGREATLVAVPEDRDIRKFPVRIFEIVADE